MRYMIRVFCLLVLFVPVGLQADDGAFGGSGSNVTLMDQADIEFVDEHVVIKGKNIDDEGDVHSVGKAGELFYTCDFTFKNATDKPVKVLMGFPFNVDDEDSPAARPRGRRGKGGDPLVYDFKTYVRDKEVPTKTKVTTSKKEGYEEKYYTYLWEVEFKPNEVIKIKHTYSTGVSAVGRGFTHVRYILKTGTGWKDGKIGHAVLEVLPGVPTKICTDIASEKEYGEYVLSQPKGWKTVGLGMEKKYVWDLKNFAPKEDLDLCVITGYDYINFYVMYGISTASPEALKEDLKGMSRADVRRLRNTVLAKYGREFKSPDLQKYFDKEWWYSKNPDYKDSMLTENDKEIINTLNKYERDMK